MKHSASFERKKITCKCNDNSFQPYLLFPEQNKKCKYFLTPLAIELPIKSLVCKISKLNILFMSSHYLSQIKKNPLFLSSLRGKQWVGSDCNGGKSRIRPLVAAPETGSIGNQPQLQGKGTFQFPTEGYSHLNRSRTFTKGGLSNLVMYEP